MKELIRWFFPTFRTFPPEHFEAALDHIGAAGAERQLLRRAIAELRTDLDSVRRRPSFTVGSWFQIANG